MRSQVLVRSQAVFTLVFLLSSLAIVDMAHRFFFDEANVKVTCIAEACGLRYRVYHSALDRMSMIEVFGFGGFGGDEFDGPPCIWRLLRVYPRLCVGDFSEMVKYHPLGVGEFWGRSPMVSPSCWKRHGGGIAEHDCNAFPGSMLPSVCIDFDWLEYYRRMRVLYLSQGDRAGLAVMQEAFLRHDLLWEIPAWEPTGIHDVDNDIVALPPL